MSVWELIRVKWIVGWQQSRAYIADMWVSLFTTMMYSLTYIILISFIFNRVDSVAGYSQTEMYLLFWVGQLAFFLLGFWSYQGNQEMIKQVNTGNLDFTLLRPVSPLWNLATEKIRVIDLITRLFIILPIYSLALDWSELDFSISRLLIAAVILFIGLFVEHVVHFLMSVTAFWYGDAQQLQYLIFGLSTQQIPYEGMPGWFKVIFTMILPTYITTSVTVSALLGKSNPWMLLAIVAAVGLVFYSLKMITWKAALKQYSSASS